MEARRQMAAGRAAAGLGRRPRPWPAPRWRPTATASAFRGQDSIRGTFSHRHAAFYDTEDGHAYFPLQNLSPEQVPVEIINSPLSEAGVLGFEYGYSLDYPDALVLWEAQFGDFANAAQVIIDQFIVSAEEKWRRLSGIVLLLPHGFEGQGPEHSSARAGAVLAAGNEENMQVVMPSTPAQFSTSCGGRRCGHWRKPLVISRPRACCGTQRAFRRWRNWRRGRFQRVIPDPNIANRERRAFSVQRQDILRTVGERDERQREDVAHRAAGAVLSACRVRQLKAAEPYAAETPVVWVQEEPRNMSAWLTLKIKFGDRLFGRFPLTEVAPAGVGHACHGVGLLLPVGAEGSER